MSVHIIFEIASGICCLPSGQTEKKSCHFWQWSLFFYICDKGFKDFPDNIFPTIVPLSLLLWSLLCFPRWLIKSFQYVIQFWSKKFFALEEWCLIVCIVSVILLPFQFSVSINSALYTQDLYHKDMISPDHVSFVELLLQL